MSEFMWFVIVLTGVGAVVVLVRRTFKACPSFGGTHPIRNDASAPRWRSWATLRRPVPIDEQVIDRAAEALAGRTKHGWKSSHTFGTCDVFVRLPAIAYQTLVESAEEMGDLHERVRAAVPEHYAALQGRATRWDGLEVRGDFRLLLVPGERVEARATARGTASPFEQPASADEGPEVLFPDEVRTQLLPDSIETAVAGASHNARVQVKRADNVLAESVLRPSQELKVGRGLRVDLRLPESDVLSRVHAVLALVERGDAQPVLSVNDLSRNGVWHNGVRLLDGSTVDLPTVLRLGPDTDITLEVSPV
ncbi:FHA domain-containing protein (plasmid) [Herbiconiux sp. KACC 21604]|uniref:FHA domain-containing protein n=1 Tax=unclassified Herbiconiux TaxID=2618217 RepID=UPI001490A8BB|nr:MULTISPECIES: FHA domain-containing protein [unclassified Herbiconiux]QJU56255.1 FHA domain-containing protein [Herbiconiux sp. SALV-R1]WPO88869.1 FHA domain-containing protein [Herbiconiux sp. KACC 21604]